MQAARRHYKTRIEEGDGWSGRLIVREHTRDAAPGNVLSLPQWAQHPRGTRMLLRAVPVLVEGAVCVKLQSRQGTKAGKAPPRHLFRAGKGVPSMEPTPWFRVWNLGLTLWGVLGPAHSENTEPQRGSAAFPGARSSHGRTQMMSASRPLPL